VPCAAAPESYRFLAVRVWHGAQSTRTVSIIAPRMTARAIFDALRPGNPACASVGRVRAASDLDPATPPGGLCPRIARKTVLKGERMIVRRASQADMAAVGELSRELAAHVNDPDPGSDVTVLLDCGFGPNRWFECLVADEANRVLGFALFCRRFEAHTRTKRLWLADLYVTEDSRREGIGHALIVAVQARAVELGCAAVDFELARQNEMARTFYEQLGAVACDGIEPLRLPA
jgi:GNAT superfamily N-acetyltransferase